MVHVLGLDAVTGSDDAIPADVTAMAEERQQCAGRSGLRPGRRAAGRHRRTRLRSPGRSRWLQDHRSPVDLPAGPASARKRSGGRRRVPKARGLPASVPGAVVLTAAVRAAAALMPPDTESRVLGRAVLERAGRRPPRAGFMLLRGWCSSTGATLFERLSRDVVVCTPCWLSTESAAEDLESTVDSWVAAGPGPRPDARRASSLQLTSLAGSPDHQGSGGRGRPLSLPGPRVAPAGLHPAGRSRRGAGPPQSGGHHPDGRGSGRRSGDTQASRRRGHGGGRQSLRGRYRARRYRSGPQPGGLPGGGQEGRLLDLRGRGRSGGAVHRSRLPVPHLLRGRFGGTRAWARGWSRSATYGSVCPSRARWAR